MKYVFEFLAILTILSGMFIVSAVFGTVAAYIVMWLLSVLGLL